VPQTRQNDTPTTTTVWLIVFSFAQPSRPRIADGAQDEEQAASAVSYASGQTQDNELEVPQGSQRETPIHDQRVANAIVLPPIELRLAGGRMEDLAVHGRIQGQPRGRSPQEIFLIAPEEEFLVGQADRPHDAGRDQRPVERADPPIQTILMSSRLRKPPVVDAFSRSSQFLRRKRQGIAVGPSRTRTSEFEEVTLASVPQGVRLSQEHPRHRDCPEVIVHQPQPVESYAPRVYAREAVYAAGVLRHPDGEPPGPGGHAHRRNSLIVSTDPSQNLHPRRSDSVEQNVVRAVRGALSMMEGVQRAALPQEGVQALTEQVLRP
jgi:hypothetical protein